MNTVEGVAIWSNHSRPGNGTVFQKTKYIVRPVRYRLVSRKQLRLLVRYKFKKKGFLPTTSSVDVEVIVSFFSHHAAHAARVRIEASNNVRRADRCIATQYCCCEERKIARQGQWYWTPYPRMRGVRLCKHNIQHDAFASHFSSYTFYGNGKVLGGVLRAWRSAGEEPKSAVWWHSAKIRKSRKTALSYGYEVPTVVQC